MVKDELYHRALEQWFEERLHELFQQYETRIKLGNSNAAAEAMDRINEVGLAYTCLGQTFDKIREGPDSK